MKPKGVVLFLLVLALAALAAVPATAAKPKRANLVAGTLSKPPTVVNERAKVSITLRVANKGRKTAGKTRAALYLATSKTHKKSDRRLLRKTIKSLRKGKSTKVKLTAILPASATPRAYRLIVCVDDTKKLKETGERDNCRASRALTLRRRIVVNPPVTPPVTPPAAAAARMAMTMSTGIDWGFAQDATGFPPGAGDQVTVTLTAGNARPGQNGYTRTAVAPQPLLTGTSTDLTFDRLDDGSVEATLPFAFPFGGIATDKAQVSTNGWISFGDPAFDYFDDAQLTDYRGFANVFGRFFRGVMPYFSDLNLKEGTGDPDATGAGTVKQVVAADGSVAIQWDAGQCCVPSGNAGAKTPRRTFQAVLYPDGRFRFDYPGVNTPGGESSFVGYSLGTGPGKLDAVASDVTSVPATSVLYTPKPVEPATTASDATLETVLPVGTSFVSSSHSCQVIPINMFEGDITLVRCGVGEIAPGQQVTRTVTFTMPDDAPGQTSPANFGMHGDYYGPVQLSDDSEFTTLGINYAANSNVVVTPLYASPPAPAVGVPSTFNVQVSAINNNLDTPTARFKLIGANGTLGTITTGGDPLDCAVRPGDPVPPAGEVYCRLPQGVRLADLAVQATPTASGTPVELSVTVDAANADAVTAGASSPVVP